MKMTPYMTLLLVLLTGCSLFSGIGEFWKDNTFSITYESNGADSGNVPSVAEEYEEGDSVQIAGPGLLAWSGYTFVEWNKKADGTGTGNIPGTWFTMPDYDVTLYALWEAAE